MMQVKEGLLCQRPFFYRSTINVSKEFSMAMITRVSLTHSMRLVRYPTFEDDARSLKMWLEGGCELKGSDANELFLDIGNENALFAFINRGGGGSWGSDNIRLEFELARNAAPVEVWDKYARAVMDFDRASIRKTFKELDEARRAAHIELADCLAKALPTAFVFTTDVRRSSSLCRLVSILRKRCLPR